MKILKQSAAVLVLLVSGAGAVGAHGNNDHVRGTVSHVSETAIVVQTTDKQPKTLTLATTTTFERSGKPATLKDLKVGDRVVVDVPKGTLAAELIKFGAPAKAAASPSPHKH